MTAIWNFRIFRKNCKTQKCLYLKNHSIYTTTMLDRATSTKFLIHKASLQSSHPNFQKIFVSPKMAAILNFRIFAEIAKHKNAYIAKTMLDKAISTNIFTHRVSLQSNHPNFPQIFVLPKMAAILNFRKNCNTQKCLYCE